MEMNKEMIFVFLLIIVLWWLYANREGFISMGDPENINSIASNFGYPRYGLRGDKLRWSHINKLYYPAHRNIRLHETSNWMYQGYKNDPSIVNCPKVSCPTNTNEYDAEDTCYQCANMKPYRMKIPYLTDH